MGAALYGGRNVPEWEAYNIYRLKDNVWEVFVSHPPESVNNERITSHYYWDETSVSNLVYYDGFLYYSLFYDDEPGIGSRKPKYIYRVPVQGGEAEELDLAYDTFCIYNGKIYYIALEVDAYVYMEMEPDGTGRREVYRKKIERRQSFTVGVGAFIWKRAKRIGG